MDSGSKRPEFKFCLSSRGAFCCESVKETECPRSNPAAAFFFLVLLNGFKKLSNCSALILKCSHCEVMLSSGIRFESRNGWCHGLIASVGSNPRIKESGDFILIIIAYDDHDPTVTIITLTDSNSFYSSGHALL